MPVKPGVWRILANRAELFHHLLADWDAFWFLNQGRPNGGFGPGPIPLSDIVAFCQMYEIGGEERENLIWAVRTLDQEFLLFVSEQSEKPRTK